MIILGTIGFLPVLIILLLVFGILGRGCTSTKQIIDKTLDGGNIIFQYEWFKQTYEDYQAIGIKINTAASNMILFKEDLGPRKDWDFEDKQEIARLNSILVGLQYQKEDIKAKYNARSKMLNRVLFKDKNLPHQLN